METMETGTIRGTCLTCAATATFIRGRAGAPALLSWSNGDESESEASVPAYCPSCWRKILDERLVRLKAFRARGRVFASDRNKDDLG